MSKAVKFLRGITVFFSGATVVTLAGDLFFRKQVKKEVESLFDGIEDKHARISSEELEGLPPCVQKWLTYSEIIGKEKITSVRSKQKAEMRLSNDKPWLPLEAEQYFTTEEPGYIWRAKVKAGPFIHIAGKDRYVNGKGSMLIQVQSAFPVADSEGKEIDQGSLVRYLAETVWFPSAVLNEYVVWKEIGDNTAQATMTYGGVEATGTFTFNEKGEVIQFEAERYGEFEGKYSMETWSISMGNYQFFEGIKVPTEGQIAWKLKEGDYLWYKFVVDDIQFNRPKVY